MDGWLRIGTKVETKTFDKQIKELERKAEELSKNLEGDSKMEASLKLSPADRQKLEADLERIKNQIISLQEKSKQPLEVKNVEESSKSFEKASKSVKKFALSLISIRSIYSLLSKASQSYMATDDKTTNQMEANWIGLGTIMKPAIDLIVNLMKKAVTSVLYFMSVLTGVNYIEKANTAILKKQTQATNELTKANDKLTTSFDEMNILKDSSSASSGVSVDTSALFDINNISESARNTIKKLGESLQPVYETIKDIIKWCLDNPDVLLVTLGGVALLTTIGKILGFGAGIGATGLIGILGTLGLLVATAWVIKLVMDGAEEVQELAENTIDLADGVKNKTREVNNEITTAIKNGEYSIKELEGKYKVSMGSVLGSVEDVIDSQNKLDESTEGIIGIWNEYTGVVDANEASVQSSLETTKMYIDTLSALYSTGNMTNEQQKEYSETLKKVKESLKKSGAEGEAYDEIINTINSDLMKLDGKIVESKVELDTSQAEKKARDYSNSLSRFFGGISEGIESFFSFKWLTGNKTKMATGGIINNPGKGVPLTNNVIGGEAGAEGVIPLTDSQAMEELGSTIGRYITINLTNNTNLDGRTIARQQSKVQANNDFATNR